MIRPDLPDLLPPVDAAHRATARPAPGAAPTVDTGRRRALAAGAAAFALAPALALTGGCAVMNTLDTDIATYGEWPSGRAPGRYAFDRLPSQQAQPELADRLEAAARPALEAAGFHAVSAGEKPDTLVQLALRTTRADPYYWDDPFWWSGGAYWSRRGWSGPVWFRGPWPVSTRYEREVAVLLRDAASGRPLYEARASTEGLTTGDDALIGAMFRAALIDFPRTGPNPRSARVPFG
jgi:hypothetical protein